MGSSLITGSGSTSSGGVLYSSSTTQEVPQESSITLENEILYTGVPIMSSTSSVDQTGVTLYTTPVVASSGEETISIPTLLQKHHRDYYKGISFRYSPEWKENYHYRNDEYIVDFISITPTTLLYCKQSHLSTVKPVLTYDSEGNVIGIDSEDWGISITVRDGRTLTWDDYTEEQKQDLIDDVLQNFNYSAIYVGEHRSNEDNDTPTLFPASEIEYAQLNDVYISTLTWGLYVCVYPGDPETAKWVYKGKIKGDTGEKGDTGDMGKRGPKGDKGDKGNSWFTGTSLTGEDYIDITISGARKGDLYLNVETGKIYQCIRDEFDGGVIETVLLDETFEQLGANETLETYNYYGTTVYEGDPITYEQSSPGTKGMNEALSGGEAPELLLARNSTLTILDVPTAGGSEIELSILSNNYGRLLIPDTDQYAVTTIEDGRYLLTLKEPLNYIDVVIENHVNSNVRIDDIHLKITEPGSSTPQKWIYTSTIDWTAGLSGKINTVPTATSGNISVFTNNGNLEDSGVSIDDIAVQNDLSNFITKSVNDLTNYYLKSETYTKDEVAALIGAIQQFHYEVYPSTSSITDPESNVLYLIGPTGTGSDKYEEYVYDSTKQDPFVKIGDTSIDLSDYVTTSILNTALSAYTTTADLTTLLAAKYEKPSTGIPESDLSSAVTTKLNATEIFWAEYGVTTAAEIDAALDAGKMVIAKDSNRQLPFMYEVDTHIYFGSIVDTASYFFRLTKSNNAWVVGVSSLEKIANRVNDITGNESSDTYYPSTKAVADYVAEKAEVFVAEYGVTTYAELEAAIEANKFVLCKYNENVYMLNYKTVHDYRFYFVAAAYVYELRCTDADVWSNGYQGLQRTLEKVTSWQATPDNAHYPSEKLVKDSLDAIHQIPSGGTSGQVLSKASGTDYDTEWVTPSSGSSDAVQYTPQTLTDAQKAQARVNIQTLHANFGETITPVTTGAETTQNRAQTLVGNENDATKYPCTKAVADALGKWGVVSQTINWAGNNTDGWTHTMSNLAYGLISNAHIELFTRAGAVFNETTGYFELNEILDISYQEMLDIYVNSIGGLPFSINRNSQFNNYQYRTTIKTRFYHGYSTSINHMFVFAAYLETASLDGCDNLSTTTNTFQRCYRLRKVIGTLSAQSWNNTTFEWCSSLESLYISKLRSNLDLRWSSHLLFDCIVFVVNSAINTTAVTITLHATAYARCQEDTTEYTYNGQTYTGILAYASAKNITIASA